MDTISNAPPSDEVRDLQFVLLAGGISALVLALVALLSDSTGVLDIPLNHTILLAILTGFLAALGWLTLRVGFHPRPIAWVILWAYTIIITIALHFTGGPQTPMPALYLLVVAAASFVLGQGGALVVAGFSVLCYAGLLILEYAGVLPIVEIWRIPFDAQSKGALLIVNWLTVAAPALLTAFLTGSLARRLKLRNLQLRKLERFRSEMVELLVHDLRNPLTVMLGGLDVINMTLGRSLNDSQRTLFDNARRSGHFMLVMIGDMLDVAKLEAGRLVLKVQPLDLKALLSEAAEQVRTPAELEGLQLEIDVPDALPPVQGDVQLIQRVLANLLNNAIKHTPAGGKITLSAAIDTDQLTIGVRDTGEGIPEDKQATIFDKFTQIDQDGLERRGTGLGLTFCKLAVEAHGGTIRVESAPGQGSLFAFALPLSH
jgi:signal transduction histidine kinase